MNCRIKYLWTVVIVMMAPCFLATGALAQASTPGSGIQSSALVTDSNRWEASQPRMLTNYIETGGSYLTLTNGFGYWSSGYARGVVTAGKDILNAEVDGQREFGDLGTYFAAGDTHNFGSNTYASITAGSSVRGFFLPRLRADAFLNQKWLGRKQLITTLGVGYYEAKDPHRDRSLFVGTVYYFDKPWVLEEGVRFNVSNPGAVFSPSGFVSITQGRNKQHYISARVGYGEEAYQIIGLNSELSDFRSQTATITWRQWIGRSWGMNYVADYYGNPYYKRAGASLGLFKEF